MGINAPQKKRVWPVVTLKLAVTPTRSAVHTQTMQNTFHHMIYTPTHLTKIREFYFLIDCWHHRILYSQQLDIPIESWQILDDEIAGPHSIASDGELFVTEDTGRHRLFVYKQDGLHFTRSQMVEDVGQRPHRVLYDSDKKLFFAIGSRDQSFTVLSNQHGQLIKEHSQTIPLLRDQYTKSFTQFNGMLYFLGEREILVASFRDGGLSVQQLVQLPTQLHKPNDLFFLESGCGYITCWEKRLFAFQSFDELIAGVVIDASPLVEGTPYYVTLIDGMLIIPEIYEHSRIVSYANPYNIAEGNTVLFDSGPPNLISQQRSALFPV